MQKWPGGCTKKYTSNISPGSALRKWSAFSRDSRPRGQEGMKMELGILLAEYATDHKWPERTSSIAGQNRGEIWISLWEGVLPTIEVTTVSDDESGGDWGSDPAIRRSIFPELLPKDVMNELSRLLHRADVVEKLKIIVEDLFKYSRRLYQFRIIE